MNTLTVDDLHFELRGSAQRRTLQVTVDRGGELILYVPPDCDSVVVEEFVREKRPWIYKKLAEKEALVRPASTKQYVNGEGFPYLGRSFRLLLVDDQAVPVKLDAGRFKMRRSAAVDGRGHMVHWYTVHAQTWLAERADRLALRVGVNPSRVVVQDLGYRWGSCGKGETLYFHWRSILLPPPMVEYVIAHELVHLHEPHHTPEFWQRVERAMPDFSTRKQWLAEHGGEMVDL
jgi:predicted metal-dependent hydrolase